MLVVAAVVIAVQYGRLGGPAPPVLPPDAPPEGVQLVYTRNPANAHGVIAYDWNGTRRGSAIFPTWVPIGRLRPAPDGSGFMLDPQSSDDYAAYFDRTGRTLYETDEGGFMSQVWADDSAHVCVFEGDPNTAIIARTPGQGDHAVPTAADGQFTLAACSLRSDAAVFVSQDEILVTRLSTGAALRRAGLQGQSAVVSADTAFIATADAVYRSSDLNRPVAQLDPSFVPLAFSGDDSLLLEGQDGGGGPVEAVDSRTGKIAWRYGAGTANVQLVVARPSAADFAVYLGGEVVILHRDGSTHTVA